MSNFDFQMIGVSAFIALFVILAGMFERRFVWIGIGNLLLVKLYWGNDICSRADRVAFFDNQFTQGNEIICRDEHAKPVLISHTKGWEVREHYAFKADQGIDLLEDECEVPLKEIPACIANEWLMAALAFFTLVLIIMTVGLFRSYGKKKEPIDQGKNNG
jgi:hypothetical protein